MNRAACLTLTFLIIALPTIACEGGRGDRALTQSEQMDEALTIALSREPDGLTKLEALRDHSKDETVHDYIDAIIDKWDAAKRTYVSPHPIRIVHECLSLTAEDRFTVRAATSIAFNVEVDEHGHPTTVELSGGTKDPELARRMKESIAKQRFVPANDETGAKPGKITLVCRVEVR